MSHSTGECPICKKNIGPADDSVVCPECGAPYHRACYLEQGNCSFEHKHGPGFEYKAPNKVQEDAAKFGGAPTGDIPTINCKSCGRSNSTRNIFCENCGSPLHQPAQTQQQQGAPQQNGQSPMGGFPFGGMGGGMGGMYTAAPPDLSGEIDGISKADWNTYIGPNATTSYIPRMAVQQTRGTKTSFFISAFLIPQFYFAYRKMWGWAALLTVVMAVLTIPEFLVAYLNSTSAAMVWGLSGQTVASLGNAAYIISILVQLVSSIFALYLYRLDGRKKIKKLREQFPTEAEYQTALAAKGGVSWAGVITIFAFLAILAGIAYYFIGPAILSVIPYMIY